MFGFPFPSNGKMHRKSTVNNVRKKMWNEFPFPSNGKAYPKAIVIHPPSWPKIEMFPFPSNGKGYPKERGRCNNDRDNAYLFPFPSNGKAYPKTPQKGLVKVEARISFHSLQTGKPIQRQGTANTVT